MTQNNGPAIVSPVRVGNESIFSCRICNRNIASNSRILIFTDSQDNLRCVVESIVGSCHAEDGGSEFVCLQCFAKLSKIEMLDEEIASVVERLKRERSAIFEDLKEIHSSWRYKQTECAETGTKNSGFSRDTDENSSCPSRPTSHQTSRHCYTGMGKGDDSDAYPTDAVPVSEHNVGSPRILEREIETGVTSTSQRTKQLSRSGRTCRERESQQKTRLVPARPKRVVQVSLLTGTIKETTAVLGSDSTSQKPQLIKSENLETCQSELHVHCDEGQSTHPCPVPVTLYAHGSSSKPLPETTGREYDERMDTGSLEDGANRFIARPVSNDSITKGPAPEKVNHTEYRCGTCSYSTNNKSNLNRHTRRHITSSLAIMVDEARDKFLCGKCGKPFSTKYGLTQHVKSKHEMAFRFQCNVCGRGFNGLWNYQGHVASHNKGLWLACQKCKATFQYKTSLMSHEKTCLGEEEGKGVAIIEPIKCKTCDKTFKSRDAEREHIYVIHEGRTLKCKKCGKLCKWRSSLKCHQKKCNRTSI